MCMAVAQWMAAVGQQVGSICARHGDAERVQR
jgi:hypothetical protein